MYVRLIIEFSELNMFIFCPKISNYNYLENKDLLVQNSIYSSTNDFQNVADIKNLSENELCFSWNC